MKMSTPTLISKSTVVPDRRSAVPDLKLSASDLPMLSCHYIQKGCLFPAPPQPILHILPRLKRALSRALALFPPLAGRLSTDPLGHVYVLCNDAGAELYHADAGSVSVRDVISPVRVSDWFKGVFAMDGAVSYHGHFGPILAVQVTELADGVFIGCSANHAVVDGTSFWNFFNAFAEIFRFRGAEMISRSPEFSRDSALISPAVLRVPDGGPRVTFDVDAPVRERIFSFSRDAIANLKARVNASSCRAIRKKDLWRKLPEAPMPNNNGVVASEISSFQALSALLWQSITRARNFPPDKTTTFRMAVNVRHRLTPSLDPFYFGNAIQSVPTYAEAGDVVSSDLRWCAEQLNRSVKAHDDRKVREGVEDWEANPRCFPLGNFDGAMITMGSSPRFPMYENDFGWGRPVAVRSGRGNKFDGKISAFPGRDGGGSVDLEVVLAPETMAGVEGDLEFMEHVTVVGGGGGRR
uniref:BAHD acyltransferase DCR n=1 Tax=Kalanchoe fedtschenkoi TaxID=63787 RepID=A0A7N0UCY9_KALFE